jgi:hypothetical protein
MTLHADMFGSEVSSSILDRAYDMLANSGSFAIVSTWLLKNGAIWHPKAAEFTRKGTLILLHQPILPKASWEALRLLYKFEPRYQHLPAGKLTDLVNKAEFDEVCIGILLFKKDGTSGYRKIYNVPTDAVPLGNATPAQHV